MENEKTLTIVLPVRNRSRIVGRTLDSIAAQSCRDFNLIIVNNGSTDDTDEILHDWIKSNSNQDFAIRLINEPRQGAAIARNTGLQSVTTPFTLFFDSDDVMRPNHIERIVNHLSQRPDTQLLRWDVSTIDPDGWSSTQCHRFHDELQLHLLHGTLSTQRYVVSTGLLREVGGWNEQLTTWDDLELGIRLILAAPHVRKIHGEPSVAIYPSEQSISGRNFSDRATERNKALDVIETVLTEHFRQNNSDINTESDSDKKAKPDNSNLMILESRRTILTAMYAREGHRELSRPLYEAVMKNKTFGQRIRLQTIYAVARRFGRGASALSLYLFGKKQERR